jgi:hypothetical protein
VHHVAEANDQIGAAKSVFFPSPVLSVSAGVQFADRGAMVVFLTEMMPVSVRTSGFALAYSLATAIFGGFTPAISTYLIHETGNRAMPGLSLSAAAPCGLVAAMIAKPDPDSNRPISYAESAVAGSVS